MEKKNRQRGVISKQKSRDFGLLMTLFCIHFWFTNDPFLYNCLSFKGPTMFAFSSKFFIFSNSTASRPEPVRWQAHWLGTTYLPDHQCPDRLTRPTGRSSQQVPKATPRKIISDLSTCGTDLLVHHVLRLGKYKINEQRTHKFFSVC